MKRRLIIVLTLISLAALAGCIATTPSGAGGDPSDDGGEVAPGGGPVTIIPIEIPNATYDTGAHDITTLE